MDNSDFYNINIRVSISLYVSSIPVLRPEGWHFDTGGRERSGARLPHGCLSQHFREGKDGTMLFSAFHSVVCQLYSPVPHPSQMDIQH